MILAGLLAPFAAAQQPYDIVIRGAHLIDPANNIDGPRDLAIAGGRVAAVAASIDPAQARSVIDGTGLYLTPGLIDLHVHVFTGTGERGSYAGDNSVYPDGFTFRVGVTTVVDAGCSGWRNFEQFKATIIDRSRTRVLALLNIVGHGMRGDDFEHELADMQVEPTVEMARKHPEVIVGIKTAHYRGPEWTPIERSVEAGTQARIPVMVDFGRDHPEDRPIEQLLGEKLRPGDIYTHCFAGNRRELLPDGTPNPALKVAKERGVILDIGHGGGSFAWRVAVPALEAGILPDTISTDLHIGSMNAGMKDMLNVCSKLLSNGMTLQQVIAASTARPAQVIHRPDLGNLSVNSVADIALLRVQEGEFGFVDSFGWRKSGDRKLICELTIREGRVVYDLNGLSRPDWTEQP